MSGWIEPDQMEAMFPSPSTFECQQCGEILRMIGEGAQQMSQPHYCRGAPSMATLRRILREEIERAKKP